MEAPRVECSECPQPRAVNGLHGVSIGNIGYRALMLAFNDMIGASDFEEGPWLSQFLEIIMDTLPSSLALSSSTLLQDKPTTTE
jgi:hypothetical protein